MKIKVSELEGPLLAEWVARARGWEKLAVTDCFGKTLNTDWVVSGTGIYQSDVRDYRPDINGGQAMELVRGFDVAFTPTAHDWQATVYNSEHLPVRGYGEEPEIAICRAVVAGEFGEFVEVEE